MEQRGFEVVVRRVGGRDFAAVRRFFQLCVALAPRGLLDRLSLRERGNIHAHDGQRNTPLFTQRPAERLVPVGLRAAQTVV